MHSVPQLSLWLIIFVVKGVLVADDLTKKSNKSNKHNQRIESMVSVVSVALVTWIDAGRCSLHLCSNANNEIRLTGYTNVAVLLLIS